MIEKVNSYTFQEVLNLYPSLAPVRPHYKNNDAAFFTKMLTASDLVYNKTPAGVPAALLTNIDDIINGLITHVYNRHAEDYVFQKYGKWNDDLSLSASDFPDAIVQILNVIDNTIEKYVPMLKLAKDNSGDLLKPVQSETSGYVKFNDTPQADDETGFADDDHVSTHTMNGQITSVDVGTLMERLNSVFNNYMSVILKWSNEFNYLFFKEEQL